MRKLLSVISATTLVGTSAMSVVSCSSNKYFQQFKGWIDNKESFLLYIGADNCPHCQDFENTQKDHKEKFDGLINDLNNSYNTKISDITTPDPDSKTAYGEKLNNKVDLRTFKTEDYNNKFTEKWSKNILNWVIDQVTEILKQELMKTVSSEKIATKMAKDKTKAYFDNSENLGFPMFLLIRNGKLVSWEVGFGTDAPGGWTETLLDQWFLPIEEAMKNDTQESAIIKRIMDSSKTEIEGDGG
ncbi:lipoprotein [Spiroplasma sp. BIUS-1]|uniref:lipoprotein n=1 Tax=Spiroplasma sp. BIUS-1 TaxID=216964 RepID=UPI0013972071|nr:lipoprotein [Spiroplasma sp. BIUS-1]QHX36827.1 hypothetical protein SBIUS_v1c05740 [Spiroplasma sp. BIUS-1]